MRICGDFDSFLLFCRMMHSSRRLAAFYLFTHSSSAVLTLIFRLLPDCLEIYSKQSNYNLIYLRLKF